MEFRYVFGLVALLVVVSALPAAADIKAITQEGQTVVLSENGTWRYDSGSQNSANTNGAIQVPDDEKAHWAAIAASQNVGDFRTYLATYPNGMFASIARLRVKDLEIGKQTPGREVKPPVNVDDISAFNGNWDFKLSLSGQCDGVFVRHLSIKDGNIKGEVMHSAVGLYQVTGKIDRHGNFKGYASGAVGSGRFEGRMSSADGAGELQVDGGELTCTGSWTAKKKA